MNRNKRNKTVFAIFNIVPFLLVCAVWPCWFVTKSTSRTDQNHKKKKWALNFFESQMFSFGKSVTRFHFDLGTDIVLLLYLYVSDSHTANRDLFACDNHDKTFFVCSLNPKHLPPLRGTNSICAFTSCYMQLACCALSRLPNPSQEMDELLPPDPPSLSNPRPGCLHTSWVLTRKRTP